MGWIQDYIRRVHRPLAQTGPLIRTVEFGLAFGCVLAAWFSTDMVLIVPALFAGWVFAGIGIFSSPHGTLSAKAAWSVVVALTFTGIGTFLWWHSLGLAVPHMPTAEEIALAQAEYRLVDPDRQRIPDLTISLERPNAYYVMPLPTETQPRTPVRTPEISSEQQRRAPPLVLTPAVDDKGNVIHDDSGGPIFTYDSGGATTLSDVEDRLRAGTF